MAKELDVTEDFVRSNLEKQADMMQRYDMSLKAWVKKLKVLSLDEIRNNLNYLERH